ncbi:putative virulence effector protein [Buttiauxella noackiae ATCC 51607]|uniref:Putative virulence effector protein n=1 Tax=Buttiauxella noackiae ATCC 51607 TaxID=1354255 RepID=A0A1B7HW53_9ENTR|nr:SrfA family protein [Buttiauxella noackiae]OAT19920.1 putative virulence effector protein [Buttiauxella noackiae ATCC 51607]
MAKTLLRSGCLDDFLSLGENGQTVFDSALQIRETLRLRKQQAVVDSLAIPQPNDEGDRVDWYAPFEGSVVSWAAASDEQRKKALRYLDNCQANVASLIQRCQQAEKTSIQLFGSLLANTMQFPGSQHVYLVDGKPVITFWGFVSLNNSARPDPLDCLRMTEEHEPVIEFLPEPPTAAVVVLSEPDEPLYSVAALTPAVPRIDETLVSVPEPEVTRETPVAKKPKRWLLPVAAAIIACIAAPLSYYLVSAPHAEPLAQKPAEVKPQTIAPAVIQAEPVAHVSTLPVAQAAVVEPPAPEPEAAAVATTPAAEIPKGALVLPADSLKIGSTKFLNGNWRVAINVKDSITGKPPTLRYQIANNKGNVRLVHGDNIVCKAEVFSGLMQSGTLMIKTRGNARCSDGSRYPLPEISCKPGENDVAQCSGRYEEDTVVPVTFKKVGD